jgi:FkbM family methyltransferase
MTTKAQASASVPDRVAWISPESSRTIASLLRSCPPFRGKARLQEWLLPRRGEVRAKVFGVEMDLDLSDVIQRDIYAGAYDPSETLALRQFLLPGMTVADVGANVGYYTWLAASMVGPSGRVLAFEPGPYAFDRLQRVIRENGVGSVETFNIALGDRSCRGTLYVPHYSVGNYNPSLTPYLSDMERVEVSIERLDTVLRNLAVHRIDLMKVDVEGHELGVFRGAERAISEKRIRAILVEFNEGYQKGAGGSCAELERWFSENRFVLAETFSSKWGPRVHNRLYVQS